MTRKKEPGIMRTFVGQVATWAQLVCERKRKKPLFYLSRYCFGSLPLIPFSFFCLITIHLLTRKLASLLNIKQHTQIYNNKNCHLKSYQSNAKPVKIFNNGDNSCLGDLEPVIFITIVCFPKNYFFSTWNLTII